jgi:hypothetical protein
MRIDISQIPEEMLADPLFLFCLADVEAKLADPNEIKAICIHEAAHLFYMTKAGMRDPEFAGPRIVFNVETGGYDRYGASVRCPNRDEASLSTMTVGEWLFRLAKAHAAGGIAARILAGRSETDCGDSGDRENFRIAYDKLRALHPDLTSLDELWAEAKRILELELQEGERREFILAFAETIQPELFKS